jgi:oligopeptide transport system substrate-binding protein
LKVAQVIQQQWRKALGVKVQLTNFERKVLLDKLAKKDFTIGICGWIPQYHDPMNILDRFTCKQNTKNYSGFENKEYRDLVDGSLHFTSKEERFSELLKAVAILNREVPFTALYHWKNPYMQKSYVKNLKTSPEGFFCLTKVKIDRSDL